MKKTIEVLEDLKISCENHKRGVPQTNNPKGVEYVRFSDRIDALSHAIEVLKRVENKTEIEKITDNIILAQEISDYLEGNAM